MVYPGYLPENSQKCRAAGRGTFLDWTQKSFFQSDAADTLTGLQKPFLCGALFEREDRLRGALP